MSDLFDYKKEMSELRFTEIQKKALAEAAASAARTPAKRRRPVFRTALIAAAMAAVLVACLLDLTLSQVAAALPGVGLPAGELALLGPTTVVWYILTECGSIVENAGALGAPVPGWLARRLERLRDRVDREKEDEEV